MILHALFLFFLCAALLHSYSTKLNFTLSLKINDSFAIIQVGSGPLILGFQNVLLQMTPCLQYKGSYIFLNLIILLEEKL